MKSPLIVAVVLNWNAAEETIECVRSLHGSTYNNIEVVIVDNASTDSSVEKIKEEFPQVKIILNSINAGYAGGNNLGISYALNRNADYILVLNNDVIVNNQTIEYLENKISSDERIGIVSCKIFYKDDKNRIYSGAGSFIRWRCSGVNRGSTLGRIHNNDKECFVSYVGGALFLARAEVFKKSGLLNEKFFMYFEDLEFVRRVTKNYLIAYTPKAIAYHASGGGTRWHNYSELYLFYHTRNRFLAFKAENILYKLYVIIFSLFITISKSIVILISKQNSAKKTRLKIFSLWKGFYSGFRTFFSNRE